MITWTTLFSVVLFLGSVCSLPTARQFSASCSLSDARLQVPAQQTQLIPPNFPPDSSPSRLVLKITRAMQPPPHILTGAVAELFDSSCLYGTPVFDTAPGLAYTTWEASTEPVAPQDIIATLGLVPDPLVLGQHVYIPSATGSEGSPKWDFTSSGGTAGNPNAYVVGAKVGDLPSSNPTVNVDNLMIKAIKGDLPPAECDAHSGNITVKYTAQYWFFGGNVTQHNI
ncbi:hypothetical protein J3R83DRAFT_4964 [Lanmaoa asiatica]|nr:hypothetical protein J3R83DRAFT_4964 [Lanmaoa asiatica]